MTEHFSSPLSRQVQKALQVYQKDNRPVCVPICPVMLNARHAASEWVCGKPLVKKQRKGLILRRAKHMTEQ
jgi:hypothetical protein